MDQPSVVAQGVVPVAGVVALQAAPLEVCGGSYLSCSVGNCVITRVRLGGAVGVGVCVLATAKMLADCRIASMVWAPKRVKGVAGVGSARASARHLDVPVAALEEDVGGMAPLWGENPLFLL